jgi:alpha-L-rhamnosidase
VLGLVPQEQRRAVLDNLVADIRRHQNHTTAGDIGFHFVLQALLEGGRSDVIYDMLSRTDSPSYGYQLQKGATALTEAWDTNPHSSQNHFMLGHAEGWFFRGLAGLDFDLSRPPSERIVIRPAMVRKIPSVSASYDSVLGRIAVRWVLTGKKATLDVTIPPDASATVYLPCREAASVTESGQPANRANGVELVRSEEHAAVFHVASGHYRFAWAD